MTVTYSIYFNSAATPLWLAVDLIRAMYPLLSGLSLFLRDAVFKLLWQLVSSPHVPLLVTGRNNHPLW